MLSILLDEVLPEQAVDANSSTFEDRYGFSGRDRDLLIRGPGPAVGQVLQFYDGDQLLRTQQRENQGRVRKDRVTVYRELRI